MKALTLYSVMLSLFLVSAGHATHRSKVLKEFTKARTPLLKEIHHSTWKISKQIAPPKLNLNVGPNFKISFEEVKIQGALVPAVVNSDQVPFTFDYNRGFEQKLELFVLRKGITKTKQLVKGVGEVEFEAAVSDIFDCRLIIKAKSRELLCKVRQSDKIRSEYEFRRYKEISYESLLKNQSIP